MKENKNILVFLYRESVGELNVSLPIIKELSKALNITETYFHFISNDKYNKIDSTYKNIISDFGKVSIGNYSFLKLLRFLINKNITIVSSDKCPVFEIKQIKEFFPYCTTILMHHAQSILYKDEKEIISYNSESINKTYNPDFFLVGNKIDYNNKYFHNNNYDIEESKILLIGALNYKKDWLNYLLKNDENKDTKIIEKKKNFKKTILVTTRAPHKEYMMEEDYKYQVNSILEISNIFSQFLFIVKPHPREKMKIYKKAFSTSKASSNIMITNSNTYTLCTYADLIISFWSSVIQDCAVTNTPVIEFHRHNKKNSRLLIYDEERLKSYFEYYGFCQFVDNKNDLKKLLLQESSKELLQEQIKNIKEIFIPEDKNIFETLEIIKKKIEEKKFLKKDVNELSREKLIYSYFKNLIKEYINKKIK